MKSTTFALAALAALAAAPATADTVPMTPPCLRNIDIWNFDAQSDKTLIVETQRHAKYKVSLIGTCSGLRFTQRLAFKAPGASQLSCLSRGDQVINHDAGFSGVCSITDIVPYTPAMEAADKAAKAAKEAAGH